MAVSDITSANAGSSLGATQVTGVQRVEQRQLQAAAQAENQEERQAESGAGDQGAVQVTETGGEERTASNTPRGSLLDITV